jgi:hypothetical protein
MSDDRKRLKEKGYKTRSRTFQKVPFAMIKKMVKAQAKINDAKRKEK